MSRDEVFEIETANARDPLWHVPWWLVAGLAIVVGEWTAHPALAIATFCLKFGLQDWLTAIWIYRRDTHRARAFTYLWLLVGSGFIKVFLVSGVAFPPLWLVWNEMVPQKDASELLIAVYLGVGGMAASFVMIYFAAWLAWKRGLKIWISRDLHHCRNEHVWPPDVTSPNQLRTVVDGSSFPAIVMSIIGPLVLLLCLPAGEPIGIVVGFILSLIGIGAVLLRRVVLRTILATTPVETWGLANTERADDADFLD